MARGAVGFSTKSTTRPVASTARLPKLEASDSGTGRAATVTSASCSRWNATIWFTSIR